MRQYQNRLHNLSPKKTQTRVFDYKRLTDSDTSIYLYEEIGMWGVTASDFVAMLAGISTPRITLRINSPGGDVWEAKAIYNTLLNHDAHVTVVVDGVAASAASYIAMAGDEIFAAEFSTMMIHDASTGIYGNAEYLAETADLLNRESDNIAGIYAKRAGGKVEDWRDKMKKETWYVGGQAAVESKLVDSIYTGPKEEKAPEVDNNWDYEFFGYRGTTVDNSTSTESQKSDPVEEKPEEIPASFDLVGLRESLRGVLA